MAEQKNDIEQVEATTPKTEEQIRAELQAEYEKIADKRVTDALKKQEKKWAEKLNAEKRTQEQEDVTKQAEQTKADEAKERDIITKSLKLAVVDALQDMGMPPSLRELVMVEDIVTLPAEERSKKLTERVMSMRDLFYAEVNKQVQTEKKEFLRGTTPRVGNGKPISAYDIYKRDGNVSGMLSEKLEAYREAEDY